MAVKQRLVLFDFDGTITSSDTLIKFTVFLRGPLRFLIGCLLLCPIIVSYLLRIVPGGRAKHLYMVYFFRNMNVDLFNEKCRQFAESVIPGLVRQSAFTALKSHLAAMDKVYVVSASLENWVNPWCRANGITCIASRIEVKDQKLTGKLLGLNCNGGEKVARIKREIDLSQFDEIIAYGDSSGDEPMLSLASRSYMRYFK